MSSDLSTSPIVDFTALPILIQIEEVFYRTVIRPKEAPDIKCQIIAKCSPGILSAVDRISDIIEDFFCLAE